MRGPKIAVYYDLENNEQVMNFANFTMKSLISCLQRHDKPRSVITVKRRNVRKMKPKKNARWYSSWGFTHDM